MNNSSYQLVRQMNAETFYITNSYAGVRRDIDSLPMSYEKIIMFGLDKDLHETIRFERAAQKMVNNFTHRYLISEGFIIL